MLRELTIENYRCFDRLQVKDLAQVNLIVGKNNVGKTSFLEAIYLILARNKSIALLKLLSARDLTYERHFDGEPAIQNAYPINELFNRKIPAQSSVLAFSVEAEAEKNTLYLSGTLEPWTWNFSSYFDSKPAFGLGLEDREVKHLNNGDQSADQDTHSMYLPISDDHIAYSNVFDTAIYNNKPDKINDVGGCYFISSKGLGFRELGILWDEIHLTVDEDYVEQAMQLIEPDLQRIGFTTRQTSMSGIRVKMKNHDTPVPLSSLGEGMRRILGLAMSLAITRSGYLIIDEIDMGLHYQTQTDMWRLVLETAKRLNVQVFATTHSWDSITAFQSALEEMEDPTIGKLIRLDARGDQLRAIEYKAEELEIAVSHGIEVR
jgi:AAA domain, putative AbiEii toxin, Type IV TA system